jgi:ubiquinone/menaquinone biosynthesis C-methylase UbiE
MNNDNNYTKMQKAYYDERASVWSLTNRDPVVGSFDEHNKWKDYQYLFDGFKTRNMIALDFGCGPGRAITLYWNRFEKIDGADISPVNFLRAKEWIQAHGMGGNCVFYITDGVSLSSVPLDTYDLVYSMITLQHICVHEIRFNILKGIYDVLKKGGWFTAQMGYGYSSHGIDYYANDYEALGTNGINDTRIDSVRQIQKDRKDRIYQLYIQTRSDGSGGQTPTMDIL